MTQERMPGRARARRALAARLSACAFAAALACSGGGEAPVPPLPGPARLSLLAVGDAGIVPHLRGLLSTQIAVGRGMEAEDRRAPVDALLLLGDNFYDEGLAEDELALRVRENVVRPYCRFLELTGPRSAEVADACGTPEPERRARPLHVVLGNHDWETPGSPRLQADAVPAFVPGWRVGALPVEVRRMAPGVDLVLFDSETVSGTGDAAALQAALAATPGPWRIVAAHQPIAYADGEDLNPAGPEARYTEAVRKAIVDSGVPVHLFLAGHVHNLQVLEGAAPLPALHVISGAGGRPKPVRFDPPARRFAREAPGFARVDLVNVAGEERLVASLFETASLPWLADRPPRLVARFSVDSDGRVRDETATP